MQAIPRPVLLACSVQGRGGPDRYCALPGPAAILPVENEGLAFSVFCLESNLWKQLCEEDA